MTANMDVRTYRARSMQDALRMIRNDLGPDAAVLHTREVNAGMLSGIFGGRQLEVTASTEVLVPSRLPEHASIGATVAGNHVPTTRDHSTTTAAVYAAPESSTKSPEPPNEFRSRVRASVRSEREASVVNELAHPETEPAAARTAELFKLFTDLIDAGFPDAHARELLETVKRRCSPTDLHDALLAKSQVARVIEEMLRVRGAISLTPGRCNVVALVGPTGVGKTTTIAKLAANFRLKEKSRVGLITVDTYRIGAVQQLRTYAEIMDLPMEVVATPNEMQAAMQRLSDLDLVLIDTAGRSPRDETHIRELRTMLGHAQADEVHLVLSSVTSGDALERSVEQFRGVGATHLLLTKIDEAVGLGSLLPLLKRCELPVTYLTNGQNVPSDISAAQRRSFARLLLGQ